MYASARLGFGRAHAAHAPRNVASSSMRSSCSGTGAGLSCMKTNAGLSSREAGFIPTSACKGSLAVEVDMLGGLQEATGRAEHAASESFVCLSGLLIPTVVVYPPAGLDNSRPPYCRVPASKGPRPPTCHCCTQGGVGRVAAVNSKVWRTDAGASFHKACVRAGQHDQRLSKARAEPSGQQQPASGGAASPVQSRLPGC